MNLQEITGHPHFVWFIAFGVVVLIHLIFYWLVFSRISFARIKKKTLDSYPPVSVVICARDEFKKIGRAHV